MQNGRAQLSFDIVADDRQILVGKTFCPNRIAGDENRDIIYKGESSLECATSVKARRLLGTDREIIHDDLRARVSQLGNNLLASRFFFQRQECAERILVAHVRGIAVEDTAHLHDRPVSLIFSQKTFVQLGGEKMALLTSRPTLRRSISNAATTSMSSGRYEPIWRCISPVPEPSGEEP